VHFRLEAGAASWRQATAVKFKERKVPMDGSRRIAL